MEDDKKFILPASEMREVKYITLENKLRVILIADNETEDGSASLSVPVGSTNEPNNLLGLAHYLEHSLFLGSKKYPEVDRFFKTINMFSGYSNA